MSGHRVDYDLEANVTIKRPNKLLAVRTGELMDVPAQPAERPSRLARSALSTALASASSTSTVPLRASAASDSLSIWLPIALPVCIELTI